MGFGFVEDLSKYLVGTNLQRKSVMSGLHTQTYSWSRGWCGERRYVTVESRRNRWCLAQIWKVVTLDSLAAAAGRGRVPIASFADSQ